jgi:DNA polymerase-3 subunit epsilon
MLPPTLAIVDVETTGQSAVYGRIIEIAVIRVEKGKIVRKFASLVNPERYISPMIQGLTGISNEDVADAPTFARIARQVQKLLGGAVFVAHNARFDYGFVKNEFAALGIPFTARCLCTVKLSRKLHPEHRRHDLTSLIERHGISCDARHRALGDAEAVFEFLRMVVEQAEPDRLQEAVNQILKTSSLPSGLDQESFDALPEMPGVYLFYGKSGELLYVGKSVNIRDRVRSHFSGDTTSAKEGELCRQVHRIEYRQTAGELGALLLESQLIKELRPIYNSMARRVRNLIVARRRKTREGYTRVALDEIDHIQTGDTTSIMGVFKHEKQATEFLVKIAREHRLCHKLLGLEHTKSYCFLYHLKQCDGACVGEEPPESYNERVEQAFASRRVVAWPFAGGILIEEKEPHTGAGEVFLIDNWCLVSSFRYTDFGLRDHIPGSHRFDYDSYKILSGYLHKRTNHRHIRVVRREELEKMLSLTPEPSAEL